MNLGRHGSSNTIGLRTLLVLLVLAIAGCAGDRTSESTGEYVDDSVITTKVKAAIAENLGVASTTAVGVETFKGIVQLSGFVDSETDRQLAEAAAKRVTGVKSVQNSIAVK